MRNAPLKSVAKIISGQSPDSADVTPLNDGHPFIQGNAEFGREYPTPQLQVTSPRKNAEQGDILLSVRAPVGALNIADRRLGIGRGICAIRPVDADTRFVWWTLHHQNDLLHSLATGSTFESISRSDVGSIPIRLVDRGEMRRIAAFLDRETAKIDALIAKQEQLIATLREDRAATITQAVTKGLNPNVEMKDSEIEWLGMIPQSWEIVTLRRVGTPVIGLTYSPDEVVDPGTASSSLVLRSSNIQDRKLSLEDCVHVSTHIPDNLRLRSGDILICSRNGSRELIGKNISIDKRTSGETFGAFMTVFRSEHNKYLFWVFNSNLFDYQKATFLSSTINQLTTSNLKRMEVPLPPVETQVKICDSLGVQVRRIDTLIDKSAQMISTLREYRSALITDAVTGKIDVREAV